VQGLKSKWVLVGWAILFWVSPEWSQSELSLGRAEEGVRPGEERTKEERRGQWLYVKIISK
jgi:hypothetical protein